MNLKLYPTMLYSLTKIINKSEQFRTAIRANGELVIYDNMTPLYTVFHKKTETFSNIWTQYDENYTKFIQLYEKDLRIFGDINKIMAKPNAPENTYTVSMIPWVTFEGFNLNVNDFNYLIPMFTMGKYCESGGKYLLPLALQVHHAVCDGFHASNFIQELQKEIDNLRN